MTDRLILCYIRQLRDPRDHTERSPVGPGCWRPSDNTVTWWHNDNNVCQRRTAHLPPEGTTVQEACDGSNPQQVERTTCI